MVDEHANRVSVADVDMPFMSMVRFMVKWAIAAIPAFLILMVLGALFWGVLLGFFAGMGSALSRKQSGVVAESSSNRTATSASDVVSSSTTDSAAVAYLPNIKVRNVQVSKTTLGESGVFGEIKNVGDRTLKEVEITIYCLGTDGKPVFEKQYHPVLVSQFGFGDSDQPLKPGYSRSFGVKLNDAPSDWSKKVDVKVTSLKFQ